MTAGKQIELPPDIGAAEKLANENGEVIKSLISTDKKEPKKEAKLKLPPKKETKNARLQLVVYPEIKKALEDEAAAQQRSINDICNYILAKAMKVDISKY